MSAEYEHPLGADRPGISKDEDVVMQQQQLSFSRTLIERLMLHVTFTAWALCVRSKECCSMVLGSAPWCKWLAYLLQVKGSTVAVRHVPI